MKILNPKTGRYVDSNGKIGMEVLRNSTKKSDSNSNSSSNSVNLSNSNSNSVNLSNSNSIINFDDTDYQSSNDKSTVYKFKSFKKVASKIRYALYI